MGRLQSIFGKRHVFLAVVHVENVDQALRNAKVAEDEGADGIFLINHSVSQDYLLDVYDRARSLSHEYWIGVNCLGVEPSDAVNLIDKYTSGLWVDCAGIDGYCDPNKSTEIFRRIRSLRGWEGLYFGGVAFKYQAPVSDLRYVARQAAKYIDVVTTSGDATGSPPSVDKIKTMREAMGDHPLAIASGITPENVEQYMPYADCFLVATGISDSHTELNPARVRQMAERLRD